MSDLDFSKHPKINSCYSRRLEEVFTCDYPKETEQERKLKQGNEEEQIQNQDREQIESVETQSRESLLSKIKPRINDCGLNPAHSKRIEGT